LILHVFRKQTPGTETPQINARRSRRGWKLRGRRESAGTRQHSLRVLRHRRGCAGCLELERVDPRLHRFKKALQRPRLFVAVPR